MEFRNKARSSREQRKSSRMARFFRRLRKSQSGLQMVELLTIMAIVVVFALLALPVFLKPVRYRLQWVGEIITIGKTKADANLKKRLTGIDGEWEGTNTGTKKVVE